VLAIVVGTDFPLVALDAYWRAAALAPCRLPWWALAGITRIESRHGTAQRSALGPRGATIKPIIGIALDGTRNTARIRDSEGGLLDHDRVWDRAVGPMQFIPSTWRRWSADGNVDGIEDPHNLYDVALAAARYLCKGSGGDMLTEAGLRRGFFSYNHAGFYVEAVLKAAYEYRDVLRLPAPPSPEVP
jgi:membrane-bound lytic murein transglycosylase B